MVEPVKQINDLSFEEAAALLHVSQAYFKTLIAEGKLGDNSLTSTGQGRISRTAVLEYKADMRARQKEGLNTMMKASVRSGLYDEELKDLPRRGGAQADRPDESPAA
ncbi:helix-turn-helix domain-containing protein [Paraburkholderia azotifigens]|uniref:Helix-turn-helix domain-containing protein n=1 Tax=Paraburkholderia azotifigens TaxID=2057004 RepID=A0A5C6V5R9_9BURK|nr:helix-turn-helix domain-containing protein [Paraburkholderia azotifigens]TXC80592.1 helix-turn-helix domain-containing protein [Paraburkholderia azotifigens]